MSRAPDLSQSDRASERSTASSTPGQTRQKHETPTDPGFPWTLPPGFLEEDLRKRKTRYTDQEKADAWKETTEVVQRYSDEMIRRWNAEIDTYLTFAGLFSAVLTAFNAQSYLLLQPSPPDLTLVALQQISLQLSSFSTGPTFVNSTHPAFQQDSAAAERPSRAVIWLNSMWFTSLILSLASAFVGIVVKQWLNEYVSGISSESGISRQQARLRQYRLNNLLKWRVGAIVNSIPVLLLLAVALFLAGLLVLLWTLDQTVAIVSSVFTGLLAVFALATMLLPSFKAGCAYLSPQSLALYHIFRRIPSIIEVSLERMLAPLGTFFFVKPQKVYSPLLRLSLAYGVWLPRKASSWRGVEKSTVTEKSQTLDTDVITTAYKAAMDPDLLATAAVCLSEVDSRMDVVGCIHILREIDETHFGDSPSEHVLGVVGRGTGPVVFDLLADFLLCFSTYWAATPGRVKPPRTVIALLTHLYFYSPPHRLPAGLGMLGLERTLTILSVMTDPQYPRYKDLTTPKFGVSLIIFAFDGIQEILRCCNRDNLPLGHAALRHATVAGYRRLRDLQPDVADGKLLVLHEYISCTNILLEALAKGSALHDAPAADLETLRSCVDHALPPLTHALHTTTLDALAALSQFELVSLAKQVYQFVNLVTEEPALPVAELFSHDNLSDLEQIAHAVRHTMLERYLDEEHFKISNRAGGIETFDAKMERLRAVRSRYAEAAPHVAAVSPVGAGESLTTGGEGPSAGVTVVEAPTVVARPLSHSRASDGSGTVE